MGDGSTQDAVEARVKQIRNVIASTEQDYEREKLSERVARLSGGVAVIQVGAQTETEQKEKKLRVEDALNATKVNAGSNPKPRNPKWPIPVGAQITIKQENEELHVENTLNDNHLAAYGLRPSKPQP